MPYEGEFAGYRSIRRLAHSKRVYDRLSSFSVVRREASDADASFVSVDSVPSAKGGAPSWVLAIDGSHLEFPVENGFPQAEVSSVTVSSVMIDLAKVRELDLVRPVDPVQFKETERAASIDACLPGSNVVWEGETNAADSFRSTLYETLLQEQIAPDSETLSETYEVLLRYKPQDREQNCPVARCLGENKYVRGNGSYVCPCHLHTTLYSTDALRIHEGMELEGSNGAMFGEVMQTWEAIWLIHMLRYFERRQWLHLLPRIAFFVDGPLAVFGHPAWLSKSISSELKRINEQVAHATSGEGLLLLGIEKSGRFADHFERLDRTSSKGYGAVVPNSLFLLTDQYIKRNIVFTSSEKQYGLDTYYGRKFLYKTKSGARLVVNTPFLNEGDMHTDTASWDQYPRLEHIISLLDQLVSSRYSGALAPIVSAHAEASIPLNLGGRVLERLALEMISRHAKNSQ